VLGAPLRDDERCERQRGGEDEEGPERRQEREGDRQ
jgi:hypothetical protein